MKILLMFKALITSCVILGLSGCATSSHHDQQQEKWLSEISGSYPLTYSCDNSKCLTPEQNTQSNQTLDGIKVSVLQQTSKKKKRKCKKKTINLSLTVGSQSLIYEGCDWFITAVDNMFILSLKNTKLKGNATPALPSIHDVSGGNHSHYLHAIFTPKETTEKVRKSHKQCNGPFNVHFSIGHSQLPVGPEKHRTSHGGGTGGGTGL